MTKGRPPRTEILPLEPGDSYLVVEELDWTERILPLTNFDRVLSWHKPGQKQDMLIEIGRPGQVIVRLASALEPELDALKSADRDIQEAVRLSVFRGSISTQGLRLPRQAVWHLLGSADIARVAVVAIDDRLEVWSQAEMENRWDRYRGIRGQEFDL